jgi:hypothetical protein
LEVIVFFLWCIRKSFLFGERLSNLIFTPNIFQRKSLVQVAQLLLYPVGSIVLHNLRILAPIVGLFALSLVHRPISIGKEFASS